MIKEKIRVYMTDEIDYETESMFLHSEFSLFRTYETVLLQPFSLFPQLIDNMTAFYIYIPADNIGYLGALVFAHASRSIINNLCPGTVKLDCDRSSFKVSVINPHGLTVSRPHPAAPLKSTFFQQFCKIPSFIFKHGLLILYEKTLLG